MVDLFLIEFNRKWLKTNYLEYFKNVRLLDAHVLAADDQTHGFDYSLFSNYEQILYAHE